MSADPVRGLGDAGQRYEVHATRHGSGQVVVVGWTNDPTGGGIMENLCSGELKRKFRDPKIVDRAPGIERILKNWKEFKKGCRKCLEQLYANKAACGYCNNQFPERKL